ncbi:hypothetical protein ACGFX4_18930 [Kitasatospora sp. NPDC048365]|uniref:hypothetical protein n=1 Tax=Kitasatospora sp. NPDC048365 TaxID=3364050 RepID=UPI003710CC78
MKDAVTFNTGNAPGQSNADFDRLARALDDVLTVNQQAFTRAVADGDADLGPAAAAAGAGAVAAALVLVLAGVRPRLREYR